MRFYCWQKIARFCTGGDHFDQTVELLAALIAVDTPIRVVIKDAVDQLLDILVHNFTHCLT